MLDPQITLFSLEATSKPTINPRPNVLLLKSCNIYVFSSGRIYSDFEDMTFNELNNNNFGYGSLDIEFAFINNATKKEYPDFYTKCFVIRTNKNEVIKPMKLSNKKNYSKINKNGELVIGIRYYFINETQISAITGSNSILIEGFIALEKPQNVFAVMCQLEKRNSKWKITSAYTYKPKYPKNTKNLID